MCSVCVVFVPGLCNDDKTCILIDNTIKAYLYKQYKLYYLDIPRLHFAYLLNFLFIKEGLIGSVFLGSKPVTSQVHLYDILINTRVITWYHTHPGI